MKLIVGILATDDTDYEIGAQQEWKKYMHKHENVMSFFLKFDDSKPDLHFNEETFSCLSEHLFENIRNMVLKSLKFMEVMLKKDSWDYMLRTNLSSVFNWNIVLNMLEQKKCYDVIANNGSPTFFNPSPITSIPNGNFLSRRAVTGRVQEWKKDTSLLNFTYPENVMIGVLLDRAGFQNIANYNYETVLPYMNTNKHFFHIRCKIFNDPLLRVIHELPLMDKWITTWYY